MARLPAVAEIFARHDNRSVPTVNNYARELRQAGYLPAGKRGVGAAHFTVEHGANMTIALAAAAEAINGPAAIKVLRSAVLAPKARVQGGDLVDAQEAMSEWSLAPYSENFGMILEALLSGEPYRLDGNPELPGVTHLTVEIAQVRPGARSANASLFMYDGNESITFNFHVPLSEEDMANIRAGKLKGLIETERAWSRSTSIDMDFFVDLGVCLSGEAANFNGTEAEWDEMEGNG